MSTDVPVHHYTCSVCFFGFGITCTMTFQLIYRGTYTQIHPKANLPVYLHASLSSNRKDLSVTATTCVHAHRSTRSWPYLFIFILSFGLTVNIYPSTFLLFCMHTCSSLYLFSLFLLFQHNMHNDLSAHLLGYVHTDPPQNKSVYIHASPLLENKDLPVTTCVSALKCTHS